MKKRVKINRTVAIILTVVAVLIIGFIILPLTLAAWTIPQTGNVALIPIEGVLTVNGASYLAQETVSSKDIVNFIKDADKNKNVKVILLEINSPGGSAVASDEISSAIKNTEKPVIALIREVGASGGYWIASATDHIIVNRMSITGSIGVISSYLEFSGLMEKYGVKYEQLVAGERKDLGVPFRELKNDERALLQKKINRIHQFFIEEIAINRNLEKAEVEKLATGEFYLGVEALQLKLVDQLGNKDDALEYIKNSYNLEKIEFIEYQKQLTFLELISTVFAKFSFHLGEGFSSILLHKENQIMLI